MSFVHHLVTGCFELHPVHLCATEREPTSLSPLDHDWVNRRLAEAEPLVSEQFWWSDGGCLWASWYGAGVRRSGEVLSLAIEIARRHGDGFVVVHRNGGEVLYPEDLKARQQHLWSETSAS